VEAHAAVDAAAPESRGDRILAEVDAKGDFPAAIQAIERVRRVVGRDDCTTLDLAHVILQDPGLSAKVLRVVNSAFYRTGGVAISTITRAIILLGFDRVSELATGLLLLDQFTRNGPGNQTLSENLRRSLRCGVLAQALSRHGGYPVPEEAYLLGMFSNLGVLWLAAHYPDDLHEAAALVQDGAVESIDEAVARTLGVSPAAIAERVLDQWNLPTTYASYFQRQAARSAGTATGGGVAAAEQLATIVSLADSYARSVERDPALGARALEELKEVLGLSGDDAVALLQRAEAELKHQMKALGIEPPPPPAPQKPARRRGDADGVSAAPRTEASTPCADASTPCAEASEPAVEPMFARAAAQPARAMQTPDATAAPTPDSPAGGAARACDHRLAVEIASEITHTIRAEHEDIGSLLGAVLEGIARSGGFDAVVLGLLSRQRDRLLARLAWGDGVRRELDALSVPLQRGAGLLAEAVLDRAPRLVPDGHPGLLVPPGAPPPALPARSLAIEPLAVHGRPLGFLLASRAGAPPVSESEASLLRLFANLACIALAGRRAAQ
jgi:HD-like signal output (HDOD) protein